MAVTLLTEEEYTFLANLHKDLTERAKTASPRAATHLRVAAKLHSDFLAIESGKRATAREKTDARKAREAEKLRRQQERLTTLQQKMQQGSQDQQATGGQNQTGQRRERAQTPA